LLCTLFTGSPPRKSIEYNFSSRLLVAVELPVKRDRVAATSPAVAPVTFRTRALDVDIRPRYSITARIMPGLVARMGSRRFLLFLH
jgi:hypothetical protein